MKRIGVFGGTFDPVHCGHLRALLELHDALVLDEVRVVPCGVPAHRDTPHAAQDVRLSMLQVALAEMSWCTLDRREMDRDGPSYTVDTLESMRAEWPADALWLLLGHDAFCGLPSWHRWRELFGLANVAVARRPGTRVEVDAELAGEVARRQCTDASALKTSRAGCVAYFDTSHLDISSSHLRALAASGKSLRWLVPDAVGAIIEQNRWYASDRSGNG